MNLEQIVKETIAKIVAEKHLTPAEAKKKEEIVKAMKGTFKGPAPAMYAIATKKAEKLAEDGIDEAGSFRSIDPNHQKAAILISKFLLKYIPQYMSANDAGKLLSYMGSELQQDNNWQRALSYYSKVVDENQLAEDNLNEDYEVAMAQDSLDSIIRAAMMLKAQMGDQEVNLPAWIQDHITNSENYINQAAKGYHESDAQIANHAGEEEMNEAIVSSDNVVNHLAHTLEYVWIAGKGNNPVNFQDMAQRLYSDMFGDDEMNEARFEKGEDVGAKGKNFAKIAKSAAERYGSKEAGQRVAGAILKKVVKEDEMDEAFVPKSEFDDYSIGDNVTVNGKKAKITAMKMDDETGERRARVRFEDDSVKDVNINSLNESKELDEWTIRRMQHYAGIK
jgi:hypothetical protein